MMAESKFNKVWNILSNYKFIIDEEVNEEVICRICQNITNDPYVGSCGCHYCNCCINEFISDEKKYCPGGREECLEEHLDMGSNVLKDLSTRRKILNIVLKCPNESCDFRTKLENIENHLRICLTKPIDCPYGTIGCENEWTIENTVKDHLNLNVLKHIQLLVEAINNLRNDVKGLKQVIEVKDEQINELKEENRRNKNGIESVLEGCLKKEILMKEEIDKINDQIRLMKDNELRIENKNKVMVNEEIVMKKDLEAMKAEIEKNKESEDLSLYTLHICNEEIEVMKNAINRVKENILNINEEFIWTIKDFSEKCNNCTGEVFTSDPFYKDDYKLCLKAEIGGYGGCLHLSLVIMRGEKDDKVEWPLKHTITISIFNQDSLKIYKSWLLNYEKCNDSSLFNKPTTINNEDIYCGAIYFNSVQNIKQLIQFDSFILGCSLSI